MESEAVKRLIVELLACTQSMLPDAAVKNEVELLTVASCDSRRLAQDAGQNDADDDCGRRSQSRGTRDLTWR